MRKKRLEKHVQESDPSLMRYTLGICPTRYRNITKSCQESSSVGKDLNLEAYEYDTSYRPDRHVHCHWAVLNGDIRHYCALASEWHN